VKLVFKLGLHLRDIALLEALKSHLGVGNIFVGKLIAEYRVESLEGLLTVIWFFDKFSLITKKRADYLLFKQAVDLFFNKDHLTIEGLKKIESIRSAMNRRQPSSFMETYSEIIPTVRPLLPIFPIPNPS